MLRHVETRWDHAVNPSGETRLELLRHAVRAGTGMLQCPFASSLSKIIILSRATLVVCRRLLPMRVNTSGSCASRTHNRALRQDS